MRGLYKKEDNSDATIEYTVNFFNINDYKPKEVSSITVTTPSKTTYKVGESLDVTGGVVTIKYTDNSESTVDLDSDMVSNFTTTSKGKSQATVTYGGKTTTFDYLVIEGVSSLSVKTGTSLSDIVLPTDSNGVYSWKESTALVNSIGLNTYSVIYTPKESKYSEYTMDVNVVAVPTNLTATYGDTLASVELPTGFTWNDSTVLVGNVGTNTFRATYAPLPLTVDIEIVVAKKVADDIVIPTIIGSMAYDSNRTLADIKLPEGWSWENPNIVPTVGNSGYRAIYTPSDTENYDYSKQDLNPVLEVTVTQATPEYEVPVKVKAYKNDTLEDVELPTLSNGKFVWQDDLSTSVGNLGSNTFKVTFIPNDTNNYQTVENIEITIEVDKERPNYTVPTGLTATYGDTLASVVLPEGFTWKDSNASVGNAGTHTFYVTYTPEDTETYAVVENIEVTVTVAKKKADAIAVPTIIGSMTYDSNRTLADIELPEGWSWENPNIVPTVGNSGYRAVYTPTDTDNYDYSEQNLTQVLAITVIKAIPTYELPTEIKIPWGANLEDIELPEGFVWQEEVTINELGEQIFKVKFVPVDSENYEEILDIEIVAEVVKATPAVEIPTVLTVDKDSISTLSDIELPEGWVWEDPDTVVGESGSYRAIYIPEDLEHYEILEMDVMIQFEEDIPNTVDSIYLYIMLVMSSILSIAMFLKTKKRWN